MFLRLFVKYATVRLIASIQLVRRDYSPICPYLGFLPYLGFRRVYTRECTYLTKWTILYFSPAIPLLDDIWLIIHSLLKVRVHIAPNYTYLTYSDIFDTSCVYAYVCECTHICTCDTLCHQDMGVLDDYWMSVRVPPYDHLRFGLFEAG